MENTKIIICETQVMHMLKCQEAEGKLIAFCHKHSLINMITFAYFILLLICCLGDSCDSLVPVPNGKKSHFHYCSNMKHVFFGRLLIRDFPAARPSTKSGGKTQKSHVGESLRDNHGCGAEEIVEFSSRGLKRLITSDYFCNVNTATWIMCKSMIWGDGCGGGG